MYEIKITDAATDVKGKRRENLFLKNKIDLI